MSVGPLIQAWRVSRKLSIEALSNATGIEGVRLEHLESELSDPSVSTLEAVAEALHIPTPWLFERPQSFDALFQQTEDDDPPPSGVDPVTDRLLAGNRVDRSLYVLLTALMQAGDPKLLRAAEVSLRSLIKQSRQATVPWQQRPSGHFEPPSD